MPETNETDLDEAVAGLYSGPLDEFVRRRDALVKELRAAGRREAAATVKNLRKPSRVAWALDLGVLGTPHAMQALDAALGDTLAAHSGSGDVRAAMAGMRVAVRELAAHAARAAEREGLPVDASALANALQAVLGTQESLRQLRRGCLAEVPESDGLDFLATLPAAPLQVPQPVPASAASPSREATDHEAARERARRAEAIVAGARERAQAARQALRDAEIGLQAAEKLLSEAEVKAQAMRAGVERARRHAETAVAELHEIERADAAP